MFDDLEVPNKLTIKDIDKVLQSIYTTWNSQKFFDLIKYFELPLQTKIKTFSRDRNEDSFNDCAFFMM